MAFVQQSQQAQIESRVETIKRLVAELNLAMREATSSGLTVDIETFDLGTFGKHSTPQIVALIALPL